MSSIAVVERAGAYLLHRRSSALFFRTQLHASSTPSFASVERDDHESSAANVAEDRPSGSEAIVHHSKTIVHHVDKSLMRFLVGKGGSVKEKIEQDNGVKLSIPRSDARDGSSVRVSGSDPAIKAACTAMEEIVATSIRSKLQYSHFISLPLASHPALVEKLTAFQESILSPSQKSEHGLGSNSSDEGNAGDDSGIEKSVFIKPATFHLTILMLKLWNEERVRSASSLLQKMMPIIHESLKREPLVLDLRGIECMRGTPAKAHVLYAQIPESKNKTRLLETCRILIDAFVESGLVLEKDIGQPLKLHATLMNTTNRKRKGTQKFVKPIPFDARRIFERFADTDWGQYPILEAHLSERFKYDDNGYYHCVDAIPFPQTVS